MAKARIEPPSGPLLTQLESKAEGEEGFATRNNDSAEGDKSTVTLGFMAPSGEFPTVALALSAFGSVDWSNGEATRWACGADSFFAKAECDCFACGIDNAALTSLMSRKLTERTALSATNTTLVNSAAISHNLCNVSPTLMLSS